MTSLTLPETTPVLIVGGGLAGLTSALLLARQGVRPMLIERHPSTSVLPQARAFNPRSMEIYRSLGLEALIRQHSSFLTDAPEMFGADTLAGEERFRVDLLEQVRPPDGVSPTDWCMIDQNELELVLRAEAERAGADVRFDVELTSLESGENVVTAQVRRGDGHTYTVLADYVIAADGHRAGIRTRLGIDTTGPGVIFDTVYFAFDADLTKQVGDRRFLLAYLDNPRPGTTLVPTQTPGRWSLGVPYAPGDSPADLDTAACIELACSAVGVADLDATIVPPVPGWPQLVSTSPVAGRVATSFRAGRVFLVGDAAHVVPPAGSYGANTAIADAHNLAWKLAAIIGGGAGPQLLDSYDAERRPVAELTLRSAMSMMQQRHTADADTIAHLDEISMIFGYSYEPDSANTVTDPTALGARVGLRAPHVWLTRNDQRVSTLDLLGEHFALLAADHGEPWFTAATQASTSTGVTITPYLIGAQVDDVDNQFSSRFCLSDTGAVLIRPDGFVAAHFDSLPADPIAAIRDAVRNALHHVS